MPAARLQDLPDRSTVFVDANVFIYGLSGQSLQCGHLLERCAREEVTGVTLLEVINSVTHRFMLAEAVAKGIISDQRASALKKAFAAISGLDEYWQTTRRLLSLNLLLVPTDESMLRSAHVERREAGLLTNDSMIVSCMREYGVRLLATNDRDFERVAGITVFRPDDLH